MNPGSGVDIPVEVFRSHSSIEAEVVRGLLDAHGVEATVMSSLPDAWQADARRVASRFHLDPVG